MGRPSTSTDGYRLAFPTTPEGRGDAWAAMRPVKLPSTVTEYLSTENVRWTAELDVPDASGEPGNLDAVFASPPLDLRAGHTEHARMGTAIYGPTLPRQRYPHAHRHDDTIEVEIGLFGDGGGNSGRSSVTSAVTELYRDGVKIGDSPVPGGGFFPVPAESGSYRLTAEAVRDTQFDVSTKVSAAWTFDSGRGQTVIPLAVVQFHGLLNETNTAVAGHPFVLPVTLQREDGSTVAARDLAVDVSYDEGSTWRKARVVAGTLVVLNHPANAKSVSLRAKASDWRGGTVEQTIIRAYKLA